MKKIHPFSVAIIAIISAILILILWTPNRYIGKIQNINEYETPVVEQFEKKEIITHPIEDPLKLTIPTMPVEESCVNWYSDYRVYSTGEKTTQIGGADFDIDFLAQLLYCEAGGMNWEGQAYTCSAILNHCDVENRTLWDAGHDVNCFEPASYVDYMTPTETQYEVIEWVLNGGRIAEICYFRSGGMYHDFGTPVCEVDGHYFSIG